ncbi:MAG: PRC-barrel domain-containing protein [Alphaproteobacteria bacterium]|nr:PRC-barrel domain-containing protein [Alphaproteobacteria bacterium]MDE2630000.1 PRC-barrel domain-containing protein [Alphaproteobacteria bacterium]
MKKLLMASTVALLSAASFSPVYAQAPASPAQQQTTTPDQGQMAPAQNQTQTSPTVGTAMQADLTGQTIYSSKGHKIGTVSSMATDAQGQQAAVVSIEKFLGMGGKNVQFPVSSLSPKDGGGYTTSLTSKEIKKLPEASAASTTTPSP